MQVGVVEVEILVVLVNVGVLLYWLLVSVLKGLLALIYIPTMTIIMKTAVELQHLKKMRFLRTKIARH